MKLPVRILLSLALAIPTACGGAAQKPAAEEPESDQKTMESKPAKDLLAKELAPQTVYEVASADGDITAKLEASGEPQVTQQEGFSQIAAPLGDGAVFCFLYPEAKGAGDVIRLLVEGTLVKNAPEHQWVDIKADQVKGWPFLMARANYLVQTPKGKALGDFKLAVAVRQTTTAVCMLDAPGMYATFDRVFRGLLDSISVGAHRKLPPVLEETIARVQLEGAVVSIEHKLTAAEPKGKVTNVTTTASRLMLGKGGTLAMADQSSSEQYKKGVLEQGRYLAASGGSVDYQLELKHEKKLYKVSGTQKGAPVTGEFPFEKGIPDTTKVNAEICKVRDGKLPEAVVADYSPDSDPLKPTVLHYTKSADPAAGEVTVKKDGDEGVLTGKLDESCGLASGTLTIQGKPIAVERLLFEKAAK